MHAYYKYIYVPIISVHKNHINGDKPCKNFVIMDQLEGSDAKLSGLDCDSQKLFIK